MPPKKGKSYGRPTKKDIKRAAKELKEALAESVEDEELDTPIAYEGDKV